jgi:hypothetical protein
MSSQTQYKKKWLPKPLYVLSKELVKILDYGMELNVLRDLIVVLKDDNKGEVAKALNEMSKEFKEVPIWERDVCLKIDYHANTRDRTWVLKASLEPLTSCSPEILVKEYKRLQAEMRKLLKEEVWVREVKQGGDGNA